MLINPSPSCQHPHTNQSNWCLACGTALANPIPSPITDPMNHPYPIIQSHQWAGRERTIHRSLCFLPRLPGTPWLAFYYQYQTGMRAYVSQRRLDIIDQTPLQIEQLAIQNMAIKPASWRLNHLSTATDPIEALICTQRPFAAERILEKEFIRHAQLMLKENSLAVAIPHSRMLMVTATKHARELLTIAANSYRECQFPEERITDWVFFMVDGVVNGRFFNKSSQLAVDMAIIPDKYL